LIRPLVSPDSRVPPLQKRAADAEAAAASLQSRLDDTTKQLAAKQTKLAELTKQLTDAAQAQDVLAGEAAQAKAAVASAQAAQAKLAAAIDKASGSVSQEGEEIHLQLVDKVMFKVGDDQLTDKGKQVLDKVAEALKEIPDKQIWVQGHTDDSPIVPLPPKKGAKPAAPVVPPPKPITNWELSAARALTVVHYLQDVQHLDPSRLAALAFGQYRPISKKDKALNRRIEIVLYPPRSALK
jgi:chemotaxis protein MotB